MLLYVVTIRKNAYVFVNYKVNLSKLCVDTLVYACMIVWFVFVRTWKIHLIKGKEIRNQSPHWHSVYIWKCSIWPYKTKDNSKLQMVPKKRNRGICFTRSAHNSSSASIYTSADTFVSPKKFLLETFIISKCQLLFMGLYWLCNFRNSIYIFVGTSRISLFLK